MSIRSYTTDELRSALREFEAQLRQAGKADNTIQTYVDRAARFINWLDGDYEA